jgi:hypothetical protein
LKQATLSYAFRGKLVSEHVKNSDDATAHVPRKAML